MTRKLAGYASVNNLQHADRQLGLFSISEKYSPPTRSKHDIAILARLAATQIIFMHFFANPRKCRVFFFSFFARHELFGFK
jgi:hypothetical protein